MKHFYDLQGNNFHNEDDGNDYITCCIPADKIICIDHQNFVVKINCPYCKSNLNKNKNPRANSTSVVHQFKIEEHLPITIKSPCDEKLPIEYRNLQIYFEIHDDEHTAKKVKKTSQAQLEACQRFYQRKKKAIENGFRTFGEARNQGIFK